MKCFGQVIETYYFKDRPWITIWDLEKQEQVAVVDRSKTGLKIGQLVSFERTCHDNRIDTVKNVQKLGRKQLPSHLQPLIGLARR